MCVFSRALIRPGRFDSHIHIPLPDVRARCKILEVHAQKIKLSPGNLGVCCGEHCCVVVSIAVLWSALLCCGQHCCVVVSIACCGQHCCVVVSIAVLWSALLCCVQHCCVVVSTAVLWSALTCVLLITSH